MQQWFFNLGDDGLIYFRARLEGNGALVGHAFRQVGPDEKFYGVPYAELQAAEAGVLAVEDGEGKLVELPTARAGGPGRAARREDRE